MTLTDNRQAGTTRRVATAAGLAGFPALLVAQGLVDPAGGGTGEILLAAATDHPGRLLASALLLLGSALLNVLAAAGLLGRIRGPGAGLATAGAVLAVLGAFGHAGLAYLSLFALALPGGDPGQMIAYADRMSALPEVGLVAFPLVLSFGVGCAVMAAAAWRAGLAGPWAPVAAAVVVVAHLTLPLPPAAGVAGLAVLTVVFGALAVTVAVARAA